MGQDHYKVLGVKLDAETVVIRAAYLALMRRYHPDQNSSQLALEKAQSVSAAYAALSDPECRKDYDGKRVQHLVPPSPPTGLPRRKGAKGRTASLLIAAATLGLLGFVVTSPPISKVASPRPRSVNSDATHHRITPLPVPPVLAAIDDTPVPAPIVRMIVPKAQPQPLPKPQRTVLTIPQAQQAPLAPAPLKLAIASARTPIPVRSHPALGCKGGSGSASASACSSVNLTYLDHLSVLLYSQSHLNADAAKRSRLMRTRTEFVARLNGCSTDECRQSTYLNRNVEIVSIMRGQPS